MRIRNFGAALAAMLSLFFSPDNSYSQSSFYEFESGQVRPLALSPDGNRLFAVNTPDNRLEVINIEAAGLIPAYSVPVGLEPVAVAARSNTEVWVVNHLSDSISIVDLNSNPPRVVRTLLVGDEPRDIVFAGPSKSRAFVTTSHRGQNRPGDPQLTTAGVGRADVWVFDANNLGSALGGTPLTILSLFGDTPRALAVSPDGNTVYAAVFHSGNQSTTVTEGVVCDGGENAPPCTISGSNYPGGLPAPNSNIEGFPGPETGLIVKFNKTNNKWLDEKGRDWSAAVRFNLPDFDVFAISASAPIPSQTQAYSGVGTTIFNMAVNPVSGKVYVTNTEAVNEVRFEGPGLGASTVQGHLHEARVSVLSGSQVIQRHLNKHINYSERPVPLGIKERSLATPMGITVSSDGGTIYIAAFGSNKIGIFKTAELENDTFLPLSLDHIQLGGGGPSGLVLDEARGKLYTLTRFNNSVVVVDPLRRQVMASLALHNPEPASILDGRKFLYDATLTSSNGEASCASCHIFGDMDHLAWDLGNPDDIITANPNPFPIISQLPKIFHPLKGPMTTQTLRGLSTHGPMHWRGDRTGGNDPGSGDPLDEDAAFRAFNVAFGGLLGRNEGPLEDADMQAFSNFMLQVVLPPNPIRNLDNSLTTSQNAGREAYFNINSDSVATCNGCHVLNPQQGFFGTDGGSSFEAEPQEFKVAHLRNIYQKIGMFGMPAVSFLLNPGDNEHKGNQIRGFGFLHDGSVDTVFRFLRAVVFDPLGSDSTRQNIEQFVLAFDSTFAPIVGQQITLTNTSGAATLNRVALLVSRARADFSLKGFQGAKECDLVVKGNILGKARGWLYNPAGTGSFVSDKSGEQALSETSLRALSTTPGQELTFSCVPPGSGNRIALDRDEDLILDGDDNCPQIANPAQEDGDGDGVGDKCDREIFSGEAKLYIGQRDSRVESLTAFQPAYDATEDRVLVSAYKNDPNKTYRLKFVVPPVNFSRLNYVRPSDGGELSILAMPGILRGYNETEGNKQLYVIEFVVNENAVHNLRFHLTDAAGLSDVMEVRISESMLAFSNSLLDILLLLGMLAFIYARGIFRKEKILQ